MMVSAKVCVRRSRGVRVVRRSISARSSTATPSQVGRHLGRVDADFQQVVVGRVLEAAVDRVVHPALEPLEAMVELSRLNRQGNEHPLHPRREDDLRRRTGSTGGSAASSAWAAG